MLLFTFPVFPSIFFLLFFTFSLFLFFTPFSFYCFPTFHFYPCPYVPRYPTHLAIQSNTIQSPARQMACCSRAPTSSSLGLGVHPWTLSILGFSPKRPRQTNYMPLPLGTLHHLHPSPRPPPDTCSYPLLCPTCLGRSHLSLRIYPQEATSIRFAMKHYVSRTGWATGPCHERLGANFQRFNRTDDTQAPQKWHVL